MSQVRSLLSLTVFVLFLPVSQLSAQEGGDVVSVIKKAARTPDKKDEKSPGKERIKKFLEEKFDRRKSVYLKTWGGISEVVETDDEREEPDKKSDGEKKPKNDEQDIKVELEAFQKSVTLGEWAVVSDYLKTFPEKDGKKAYAHLLDNLSVQPNSEQISNAVDNKRYYEQNVLLPDDVLGLADAAPCELDKKLVEKLARLLSKSLSGGGFPDDLVEKLKVGTNRLGGEDPSRRLAALRLLINAGQSEYAGAFLPDNATLEKDVEVIDLVTRYYLYLSGNPEEERNFEREKAWALNRKILAMDGVGAKLRQTAMTRAANLAPLLPEEMGEKWLEESFTKQPERGMEVLAAVGAVASRGRPERYSYGRLRKLKFQNLTAEALLKYAPEQAELWARSLDLLALNWLDEADFSRDRDRSEDNEPERRRDRYGNTYYAEDEERRYKRPDNKTPEPIKTKSLLEIAPDDAWQKLLDPSLQPRFDKLLAQLHLKVEVEEEAFPYIERLAATHPEEALELADEFVRVWGRSHDPNRNRNRTSSYYYYWGYNERADSIPLTRSKQQRNLEELSRWVRRLNALPIGELDEEVLAEAFVTAHSSAEVYRLEDIQKVFGESEKLKPKTYATLLQTMRKNLANLWRKPKTQQQAKTKRKDREVQQEVLRGYAVATAAAGEGRARYPESWELELVHAALLFDHNNYRKQLADDAGYSVRRKEAFDAFAAAHELYVTALPELPERELSGEVYQVWFSASIGACDLGALRHDHLSDETQQERIREAILSLPGEAAEDHMARFANDLSNRVTSVKAEMKHRYLRAGIKIAGNHEKAGEARKIFSYYDDLITEIQLDVAVDGSDTVGHTEPFGLFVNLRHTKMIERESGGFSRYLQNQNNGFGWNYGRPTENYREKFEEAARVALKEHFDVLTVTFHSDKIQARGDPEPGWSITPYAYILLKARGAEVDTVPPLRIDMDFLDTSGYAVLPIESAKIPIDAGSEMGEPRPVGELVLAQTLDERDAADGKLGLEVRATAQGLVPPLDQILDFEQEGFEVTSVEDEGVSVVQLDAEADENTVLSERLWTVGMRPAEGFERLPKVFRFSVPKMVVKESTFQRYDDQDLEATDQEVRLLQGYGEVDSSGVWLSVTAGLLLLGGILFVILRRPHGGSLDSESPYHLPEKLDPFTVIALLRQIRSDGTTSLSDMERGELEEVIRRLEGRFFCRSTEAGKGGDLKNIAMDWIRRAA